MKQISFKKKCRNCLHSNEIEKFYMDTRENINFESLTDYELSKSITDFLEENNILCEYCGERNFDLDKIKLDENLVFWSDYYLDEYFVLNNINYLSVNMEKIDNITNVSPMFSRKLTPEQLQSCKNYIFNQLDNFDENLYTTKSKYTT